MEPQHPCELPPVGEVGEHWQCDTCGAGWIVEVVERLKNDTADGSPRDWSTVYGWVSGPRWVRTSWTRPYVD